MNQFFQTLASGMTPLIVAVFAVHCASLAFYLRPQRRRIGREMARKLDHFTHGLKGRPILDETRLDDSLRALIEYVQAVLHDPQYVPQRGELRERIEIIDEDRSYSFSEGFERFFNFWRSMIEVYPLLGILGTVLAIAASIGASGAPASQSAAPTILSNFGYALQSTIAGLGLGVVMIGLNAWHEVGFERLVQRGAQMRETVNKVKRELALQPAAGA